MNTILFYGQPEPTIDHLTLSMAIVAGLAKDFKIYFVNGGAIIRDFLPIAGVEIVNLPKVSPNLTDSGLNMAPADSARDVTLAARRDQLLELCDRIHPDAIIVELFPFGYHQFATELMPLLEWAKGYGAKTICSLPDIVTTAPDQAMDEANVCQLINHYFDQLLIHSDPSFIALDQSFSRVKELTCEIHYTGYVAPDIDREFAPKTDAEPPMILVSVGGGHFGHELLDCVAEASQHLEDYSPHHIQMFTGPWTPTKVYHRLQKMAACCPNLNIERYTPNLLSYIAQADLFISIAGYNTTLNILQTGVRAMQLPLSEHPDHGQRLRCSRLEELGMIKVMEQADLQPIHFSLEILEALNSEPQHFYFCLRGVQITAARVKALVTQEDYFAPLTRVLKPFS